MIRSARYMLIVIALSQAFIAAGYLFRLPLVVGRWPLPYTSQMSFTFLASIAAAAAVSTLWCLAAREYGALAGIALDYLMIFTPLAILALQLAGPSRNDALRTFGLVCIVAAVFGLGLFLWSRRIPFRDPRPMPGPVRWSFAVLVVVLLVAGGGMVLKVPGILPWRVSSVTAVIYGWMFLGAAAYFAYGLLRPRWANASGQLAGFLAYDLVLIGPFLARLGTVDDSLRLNLIVYIGVLAASGLLALYYLFLHPVTRLRRRPLPPYRANDQS